MMNYTPKQLLKMKNRMINEEQRLAKLSKKANQPKQISTGLSKGQRRRLNKRNNQALPRGLPGYPTGLPVSLPASSSMGNPFPTGAATRGPRRMTIAEDEFITNISGSVSFSTQGFYMNPGQILTFPWLSTIAKQFEKYTVNAIEFYYRPLVSGFATNGQSGKIILSFDYDAADPLPSSKIQAEDTHPHADAMPYESVSLRLSPMLLNDSKDGKYVRPRGLPASADIKTYDGGLLAVSTQGCTNTSEIGELRVRYSIDLHVPVLESQTTVATNFHTSVFSLQTTIVDPSGAVADMIAVINPLGITEASGVFQFPAGNYVATVNCEFAGAAMTQSALWWDFEPLVRYYNASAATRNTGSFQVYFTSTGSLSGSLIATTVGSPSELEQCSVVFQSI